MLTTSLTRFGLLGRDWLAATQPLILESLAVLDGLVILDILFIFGVLAISEQAESSTKRRRFYQAFPQTFILPGLQSLGVDRTFLHTYESRPDRL